MGASAMLCPTPNIHLLGGTVGQMVIRVRVKYDDVENHCNG